MQKCKADIFIREPSKTDLLFLHSAQAMGAFHCVEPLANVDEVDSEKPYFMRISKRIFEELV